MTLFDRWQYTGVPVIKLNESQKNAIIEFNQRNFEYENVPCIVCKSNDYEILAEQDRLGLKNSVVICKECGLVRTNPRMTQQSYKKFYELDYRKINEETNEPTNQIFDRLYRSGKGIYENIQSAIDHSIEKKFVVEIGCACGGNLQYFKEKNNRVYGVDYTSDYVEFGKKKGLDIEIGTIENLEKITDVPDIVIYNNVLEHILNPIEELEKLRNFLSKDTLLYIDVPSILSIHVSYEQNFLYYLTNAHTYHFTKTSLQNVTKKAGFKTIWGDEAVHAVLKLDEISNEYSSTYNETMNYLKRMEKLYSSKFNKYKIYKKLYSMGKKVTEKTKTKVMVKGIIDLGKGTKYDK